MATIILTITDDGMDGSRPAVGVALESDPPFPLDDHGRPEVNRFSPAQAHAFSAAKELAAAAGTSRTFTQDGDTITGLEDEK